jgi:hypothetical protein
MLKKEYQLIMKLAKPLAGGWVNRFLLKYES